MNETFKRILVPLDGSRLAESVLPISATLAGRFGATIVLLHIIEEHAPSSIHGEPHLTSASEAEAYLTGIAEQALAGLPVEHHVHGTEEQDVAVSVASHAEELNVDLVVLCTHGRSGLRRVVSGSIAQQVLRRVTVPLLLVRPDTPATTNLDRVMVPLDGTPDGETALPVAAAVALALAATLYLVRVVPTVQTVTGDRSAAARLTPISTAAALDVDVAAACTYLDALTERLAGEGVTSDGDVRRGDVVQELSEAARMGAGMIVIATHGRAGLGALWIGSVAAGIIGKTRSRPLLLVRIPEA